VIFLQLVHQLDSQVVGICCLCPQVDCLLVLRPPNKVEFVRGWVMRCVLCSLSSTSIEVDQLKHLLILFSLLLLLSCVVTQLRDPTITGNGTKILFVMVPTSLTRLTRNCSERMESDTSPPLRSLTTSKWITGISPDTDMHS
jgi:hypothetical protein